MNRIRKLFIVLVIFIACFTAFTIWANRAISNLSSQYLTGDMASLKPMNVGLLLGTSKLLKNGNRNDFFYNRIKAAVELYKNKKIKYILVSGDNSLSCYNEPFDMKTELVKNGIPDSVIVLDCAGFRTFDSILRAKEIFGQSSFIIISQKFHNERAVYIARKNSIEAFGYNAKEVTAFKSIKTKFRELFARDKVFFDDVFGVKPKFLGNKIKIG
jgi:SanA protein